MSIKIYADGADLEVMRQLAARPDIAGFTTNPTLMRQAGVPRYRAFAQRALEAARGKPVSLEVFVDDFDEMVEQARAIAQLGANAVVKIPVTDTRGVFSGPVIEALTGANVQINVTGVFTADQVRDVLSAVRGTAPVVVSVFAGRVADTGVDPLEHVRRCRPSARRGRGRALLLWASPRQVYDVVQAEAAGCDIITLTPDLIAKLPLRGKDLGEYSLETVRMFYRDAREAGYVF